MSQEQSNIHKAVLDNNLEMVHGLLNSGTNVDELDSMGKTPLHVACTQSNTTIARALIQYGANVNFIDLQGVTCLYLACNLKTANVELVDLLLFYKADVHGTVGFRPIYTAFFHAQEDVLKLLLQYGANPDDAHLDGTEFRMNDILDELAKEHQARGNKTKPALTTCEIDRLKLSDDEEQDDTNLIDISSANETELIAAGDNSLLHFDFSLSGSVK